MRAFKFVVSGDRYYALPSNPDVSYRGCLAVVLAETEAEAHRRLDEYAALDGMDAKWLEVARVIEIPLVSGAVLAWVMV